jgi:hypothetical protein
LWIRNTKTKSEERKKRGGSEKTNENGNRLKRPPEDSAKRNRQGEGHKRKRGSEKRRGGERE